MKESVFKKNRDKVRTEAHFTKNDAPVSSFPGSFDKEKLVETIMRELGSLFSGLKSGGFSKDELEISLSQKDALFSVSIKHKGKDFSLGEINLICRLATDLGLSVRINGTSVEILAPIPMLEGASLYAEVLSLIRDEIDSTLSEKQI